MVHMGILAHRGRLPEDVPVDGGQERRPCVRASSSRVQGWFGVPCGPYGRNARVTSGRVIPKAAGLVPVGQPSEIMVPEHDPQGSLSNKEHDPGKCVAVSGTRSCSNERSRGSADAWQVAPAGCHLPRSQVARMTTNAAVERREAGVLFAGRGRFSQKRPRVPLATARMRCGRECRTERLSALSPLASR